MTQYLQYWKPKQVEWDLQSEGTFEHSAGAQLGKVRVGDIVWVVTVFDGELYIVGRMDVGECVNQKAAEKRFPNPFESSHHLIATPGTEEDLRLVSIADIAGELRFESKTQRDRLTLLNNRVDGKQLQSMRVLSSEAVGLMETAWWGAPLTDLPEVEHQISVGAGFGDAATNKLVETAAVLHVSNHYSARGWDVESVERLRCGYERLRPRVHEGQGRRARRS
jgi:hypothetical protein